MSELSVLLVEDDQTICKAMVEYANQKEEVSIISVTNNATKALEEISYYMPQAVILDLELHHGSGSGLDVLNGIKNMELDVNPYILITTNNSSAVTYEYARQLGADFIMSKHQNDYSERSAIDFLIMMKSVIQSKIKSPQNGGKTSETPEQYNKRINRRIISELNLVGVSPKAVGYQYLIDAIHIVIEKPTQNISAIIGEKYGKTNSSVERAMQNAINRAWRTADIDDLLLYYTAKINSDRGVPTITEFIYYYANKIKNQR